MEDRANKLHRADAVGQRLAGGGKRRGFNQRRLARALLLGALAVAASIYWLAVEYDVNRRELLGHLGASTLFVAALSAAAAAGAVMGWAVKRLLARFAKRRR